MKRFICKPDRRHVGRFAVVDTATVRGYLIADDVTEAKARAMVRELERTFS